jgi:HD-GYP domain-containing protein (c-di-GMP phosphodiesterase class II)
MRYVAQSCLRPGQQLAVDLRINDNQVFLRNSVILTPSLIERIKSIGFQGAYIDDDISKDLAVASIISEELIAKAKTEIKNLFIEAESGDKIAFAQTMKKIRDAIEDMVEQIQRNSRTMVNIVDIRTFDNYTYSHSLNVAVLASIIGTMLDMEKKILQELATSSLIHDIGKVFITKAIVNKPAILDENEYNEMKKHAEKGYEYLRQYNRLTTQAMAGVYEHHERYGGEGYPRGLKGDHISLFGRIIGIADVYDALTSDRPYRHALLPSDAVEYIMGGFGNQFDPAVVRAFIRKVAPYPVGTCVILSNGILGIVTSNNQDFGLRPVVRVIEQGEPTQEFIDLSEEKFANITITGLANEPNASC